MRTAAGCTFAWRTKPSTSGRRPPWTAICAWIGFATACAEAGIVFIGPSPEAIRLLGSKTAARILAKQAGAPVVPGSEEPATNVEQARKLAREIGYPVLLKAAAGGGGKGMRRVDAEDELESAIRDAASEAERAFQNGAVYLEKFIEK